MSSRPRVARWPGVLCPENELLADRRRELLRGRKSSRIDRQGRVLEFGFLRIFEQVGDGFPDGTLRAAFDLDLGLVQKVEDELLNANGGRILRPQR